MTRFALLLLICALGPVPSATAQQVLESAGSRALGMGGAFVAVADDATAVYWNPAGLAFGPTAGGTVGYTNFHTGDQAGPPTVGPTERTSKFVSLGTLPVGFSYGTFEESALVPATLLGRPQAATFEATQFGATFVQTIVQGLVAGTTVKYVRGSVVSGPVDGTTAGGILGSAAKREAEIEGRWDLDLGTMVDMGKLRVGLLVRNLTQPTFGRMEGTGVTLQRQSRLGFAFLPTSGLTLAIDLDLDTVDLRDGPRRMAAIGGEQRLGRLAIRAGTRWNREVGGRAVAAVGGSVLIRPSMWLDTHYTDGHLDSDHGWGIALRVGS
jgi:hypothetical protein